MSSSFWIEHFYRNACTSAHWSPGPATLSAGDLQILRSIRTGSVTACAEDRLLAIAKRTTAMTGDPGLLWAVRMFVQEQTRQNSLICGALGEPGPWRTAIAKSVLDRMDCEYVLLLLSCRARVASTVLTALREKTQSEYMRELSGRLAAEQVAQVQFASYVAERMRSVSHARAGAASEYARRVLTVAMASRFWMRQRSRLRECGHDFSSFVGCLLRKPMLAEAVASR